jgi:hypothetical protein
VNKSIKKTIEALHSRIVVEESVTTDILKLARSLKTEHFSHIKKIFLYLREQGDMDHHVKLISTIFVKIFSIVPRAIHFRDFFSLMSDILYTNTEMDEVDANLLEDLLKILTESLRQKQ